MNFTSRLIRGVRPLLARSPLLRRALGWTERSAARWRHSAAAHVPSLIKPAPRQITIAITAACNLRCMGCRYGRDFMVGEQLDLATVTAALDDAAAAGVNRARFYGGEPLLHPDLPRMIAHARSLGLDAYVTTNATLLERRVDELVAAGMRWMTIGFYGLDERYDDYTQRPGHFAKLRAGLTALRARHGDRVQVQLNYMLSRRSGTLDDLRATWAFAREFDLFLGVDPISKTIPFFQDPTGRLDFDESHRERLEQVTAELLRLKREFPHRIPPSATFLRALPDLLLKDAANAIPCDAYELLWIGADGSVQLCDVAFPLGNLKQSRLRDLLFTPAHCQAARDGFQLKCPTCMCKIDSRIRRDAASVRRYGN